MCLAFAWAVSVQGRHTSPVWGEHFVLVCVNALALLSCAHEIG